MLKSNLFFVFLPLCEIPGDLARPSAFLFQTDHASHRGTSFLPNMVSFLAVLGEHPACPSMVRLVLTHPPLPQTATRWRDQCTAVTPPPYIYVSHLLQVLR